MNFDPFNPPMRRPGCAECAHRPEPSGGGRLLFEQTNELQAIVTCDSCSYYQIFRRADVHSPAEAVTDDAGRDTRDPTGLDSHERERSRPGRPHCRVVGCRRLAERRCLCATHAALCQRAGLLDDVDAWLGQIEVQCQRSNVQDIRPSNIRRSDTTPPSPPVPRKEPVMPETDADLRASLTRSEKMRYAFYLRKHPGVSLEDWIAQGKPKAAPGSKKAAKKKAAKQPRTPKPQTSRPAPPPTPAPGTQTPAPQNPPSARAPLDPRLVHLHRTGQPAILTEQLEAAQAPSHLRMVVIDAELTSEGISALANQIASMFNRKAS